MPLKWEIFHDHKLVHITANGRVTLPEARAWLKEVAGQVDDQRTQPFHTPKG